MCGFVGVVAFDHKWAVSPQTLDAMAAHVAHRGPDGRGTHIDAGSTHAAAVALAHCRLAILDPDPRSNQPMRDLRGRWIVFNGEIYNFRDLRNQVSAILPAYPWRTQGDTEVLLAAYEAWGDDFLGHLNGMFALALWDGPNQRLFLARDRMGQKPLYVAQPPGGTAIAFASELSPLRELDWMDRQTDATALSDYLCWGYIAAPRTIYRGARQLEPGTSQAYGPHERSQRRYFDPATGLDSGDPKRQPLDAKTLVRQAVQRQMISDVPVGCFLSGGIDSSVVALTMRDVLGNGSAVHTFSIGFEDRRYDESSYAAAVARHLGTRHESFLVKPDAAEDLAKLARVFGEPFADSSALAVHYLSHQTRGHVKVALSGDGGDELFGGYDRYRAMALSQRLPSAIRWLLAARLWQQMLPGTHPKSKWTRLKRLLAQLDLPLSQRYSGYLRLFDDHQIDALMIHDWDRQSTQLLQEAAQSLATPPQGPVALATALDRLTYLPNDLLTKLDRASMLHALEVRSPFMDHELVAYAAGLSDEQLIGGGPKRMLRQAFAPLLPPFVFRRQKMGFALPIGAWFRGQLKALLRDHLFARHSFAARHFQLHAVMRLVDEHESAKMDHAQRLYALLMLELWWKTQ